MSGFNPNSRVVENTHMSDDISSNRKVVSICECSDRAVSLSAFETHLGFKVCMLQTATEEIWPTVTLHIGHLTQVKMRTFLL